MLVAYSTGLILSFSLILAIGSQNAFVLRQAILREHIGAVILFCAISDALLIIAGVFGVSFFIKSFVDQFTPWLFGVAAIWLIGYGLIRTYHAFGNELLMPDDCTVGSLRPTLLALSILTFGNPHVYLDTVVLMGTISLQFNGLTKLAFAFGAITASSVFFVGLGYSGYLLSDVMLRPRAWRALNAGIALIMFSLAAAMIRAGGWF